MKNYELMTLVIRNLEHLLIKNKSFVFKNDLKNFKSKVVPKLIQMLKEFEKDSINRIDYQDQTSTLKIFSKSCEVNLDIQKLLFDSTITKEIYKLETSIKLTEIIDDFIKDTFMNSNIRTVSRYVQDSMVVRKNISQYLYN